MQRLWLKISALVGPTSVVMISQLACVFRLHLHCFFSLRHPATSTATTGYCFPWGRALPTLPQHMAAPIFFLIFSFTPFSCSSPSSRLPLLLQMSILSLHTFLLLQDPRSSILPHLFLLPFSTAVSAQHALLGPELEKKMRKSRTGRQCSPLFTHMHCITRPSPTVGTRCFTPP